MKLFAELTREELRLRAPDSLAVMPLGATEQHGPHLPAGTDLFTVESIAREAAERASERIPVIVTPPLPFGSSDHHLIFGATMSLSTETYYKVLCNLIESLVKSGFTRIFLINGHGGNHELAHLAARDVALHKPARVAAGSYWTIAWNALIAAGAHLGRRLPGHAGDFETSVMLSLRPELVAADRPRRESPGDTSVSGFSPYRHERHNSWRDIDGFTDSPHLANADNGSRFRAVIVDAVANAFVDFYSW